MGLTFLKRRRTLLAIFLFSLTYCIIATYTKFQKQVVEEEDIVVSPVKIEEILKTVKPFVVEEIEVGKVLETSTKQHHQQDLLNAVKKTVKKFNTNTNSTSQYLCRNSVQGRAFIADENGYICDRFDLQANGCCKVDAPSTKRYKCDNCSPAGCCSFYEQCVSCCLHPQKVKRIINDY